MGQGGERIKRLLPLLKLKLRTIRLLPYYYTNCYYVTHHILFLRRVQSTLSNY
jgi:hypothetical protein